MPPCKDFLTAKGKTQSLYKWEKDTGIPVATLKRRFHNGWSHDEVITLRPYEKAHKARSCQIRVTIEDVTLTIPEWSFCTGLPDSTIRSRMKRGLMGLDLIGRYRESCIPPIRMMQEYGGNMYTINELSKMSGLCYTTVYNRIKRGWDMKDVMTCPTTPQAETAAGRIHLDE